MNRPLRLLVAAAVAVLSIGGRDACVANVTFPFNNDQEDWQFGTILPLSGTSPYWEYYKAPGTDSGALQAMLLDSGSGAGAWAMSPCLVLNDEKNKLNIDIAHFTLFPDQILGQVQYRVATTDSLWGPWTGIPSLNWLSDGSHTTPTAQAVFPPLLSSSGTFYSTSNDWVAFSGTNIKSGTTGAHVLSSFTLTYGGTGTDLGPGVVNDDEIQFRFVLGIDREITASGTTPAVLWEVNEVTVNGVKLCKPVPEPATIVLAGTAALFVMAAARRSRNRRSRCRAP